MVKNHYMLYISKAFLVFLVFLAFTCEAQYIYPIGSELKTRKLDPYNQWDYMYELTANLRLKMVDEVPDTVVFDYAGLSLKVSNSISVVDSCDSTVLVSYSCRIDFWGLSGPWLITVFLPKKYRYYGVDTKDTLHTYYYIHGLINTDFGIIANCSPEFDLNTIDVIPGEKLNVNLYRSQNNYIDSLSFLGIGNSDSLNTQDQIKVHPYTGNLSWRVPEEVTLYKRFLALKYTWFSSYMFVDFTINADSNVKGRFLYDTLLMDNMGHIGIEANYLDTFRFRFSYIDKDADEIEPVMYSTLEKYGVENPIVEYTKHGDTLNVDFKLMASSNVYKNLPGAYNFHLRSKKHGRRCFNRYFSFYIKNPEDRTGISEEPSKIVLQCFPNPAIDFVSITGSTNFKYNIYDLLGKMVCSGNSTREVSTSELVTGIYFLLVSTELGESAIFKIIKE